jgi:pimeloyl-ACP methyl ester carboxylesterase
MFFAKHGFELWFEIQQPAQIHQNQTANTDNEANTANLLIHGWTGNRTRLQFIVHPLLECGQSVIMVDLPGHAESRHIDNFNYELESVAKILEDFIQIELIQKMGFKKINIIAHSMGGVIAQILASKQLPYIHKLVLLATSPNPMKGKKFGYRILSFIFPIVSQTFLENDKKKKLALGIDYFPEFKPENQKLLPNRIAIARYLKQIVKTNLETQIQQIQCPVLIIMGENDSFGDSKAVQGFEKHLKQKQIVIIENTEHYPFLTHTETCIERIIEFLC